MMYEEKDFLGLHFSIEYCEVCDSMFVRCPKCNNNTCNGGSGTDKKGNKCSMCYVTHKVHDVIQDYLYGYQTRILSCEKHQEQS